MTKDCLFVSFPIFFSSQPEKKKRGNVCGEDEDVDGRWSTVEIAGVGGYLDGGGCKQT